MNYGPSEEMVEGVEDMQIRFGVGTDDVRAVEEYDVADSIWSGTASNTYPRWRDVRSVRAQLMLHSPDKNTLAEANPIEFEIEKLANVSVDEYEDWKASSYTD
jgi:type IV pilus assembly protein PilW